MIGNNMLEKIYPLHRAQMLYTEVLQRVLKDFSSNNKEIRQEAIDWVNNRDEDGYFYKIVELAGLRADNVLRTFRNYSKEIK